MMTDKPKKPTPPDPTALPAEHRQYAEDNAAWHDWCHANGHDPEAEDFDDTFEPSGESGAQ